MDMKVELEQTQKQMTEIAAYIQKMQQTVNSHQLRLMELQGVARFLQEQLNPKPKESGSKDETKK